MNGLSTNWDEVKQLYDKGMTDQELADNFKIKKNTVRMYRTRHNWGKANRKKRVSKKRAHVSNVSKKKSDTRTQNDTQVIAVPHADEVIEQSGLKDRQKLFCSLYLRYYNATKAYQLAYGVSYNTALSAGPRMLGNVRIQELLTELKREQSRNIFADTADVLMEYLKQMKANISDYVDSQTIKTQRKDANGNPASDANGDPIYDYQTEIWLKDLHNVDLSVVDEMHKGKDGIVVKMAPRQHAMDKLLDWLHEPVSDKPQENPFLKAWKESPDKDDKEIFDEHPNKFEIHKAEKSDDDES